jgi:TatD DNase family protein
MDLFDIHTHESAISDSDDDVPKRCATYVLNVYPLGFEYAKDSDVCDWFSCGVHPWYSDDAEPQLKFLKEIANDPRIVAIGEAGLDKLKGPDLATQQQIFVQQIELSEQLQKPLIIHCVKAWDELAALKKKHKPAQPWIIHGYRGKAEQARQLAALGFMFSIGDKFHADALRTIPINCLFCETDESDLEIEYIYARIAEALDMKTEDFAEQIAANVKRVFPLMAAGYELQE